MMPQPKLLVVDDTPESIALLTIVLSEQKYVVTAATSGTEALEQIAIEAPDLILLDVVMPGMDGFEVCRRLRGGSVTKYVPIIMLTANAGQERRRALEVGADDFIQRPFDEAELLARVSSLLRIKQYHDEIERMSARLAVQNETLQDRVAEEMAKVERLERLKRFVSAAVAESIDSSPSLDSVLETHRREIAVVYCGLRGFATLAESEQPEVVLAVLREYHDTLGAQVHKANGTVGHLAGDGLMVFFNDPIPCPDPAAQAVQMTLAMRAGVNLLAEGWCRRGYELAFCAGIEFGFVTLGMIGFEGRYDYGAIGLVTTIAAGLCEEAEDRQILISQSVYAAVQPLAEGRSVGQRQQLYLKGLARPVSAYSIEQAPINAEQSGRPGELLTPRELEVARLIARGFSNRQISEALIIQLKTVDIHLSHIYAKLGVQSRTQLAVLMIQSGC